MRPATTLPVLAAVVCDGARSARLHANFEVRPHVFGKFLTKIAQLEIPQLDFRFEMFQFLRDQCAGINH